MDRRMAAGDKLSDIFDGTDYYYGCYSLDEQRPVCVRIGKLYNYVSNNFVLFDNWFVWADEFQENDMYSYAYRRFDETGHIEGAVLIKRDGTYATREEFRSISFGSTHNGHGRFALVRQFDNLLNIVDVETGVKLDIAVR